MSTLAQQMNSARFTPKYVELARKLLREIAAKGLKPGDRLPTEVGIAEQYDLSRVTVRQALDLLESEGIISRVRARGTFIERAVDSAEHIGIVGGTVLLICSNEQRSHMHEDTAFATILCDIEQTLAQRGFTVQLTTLVRNVSEDRARLTQVIENAHDLRGAIVLGRSFEPYHDLFADVTVVTMATFRPTVLPWVGVDVPRACRESVAHLIEHGHRRVAMVCGPGIDQDALAGFLQGYREAHDQAGIAWQRSLIFHCHPDESLEALAESALTGPVRPTAVFAENWQVCRAILAMAERLGVAVPEQLSVVGFGQNVSEIHDPVPITAYVPTHGGDVGAALLADLITEDRKPPTEPLFIPGTLVLGDSVRRLEETQPATP